MVRFFPIADWAPAQEAIYDDPHSMPSIPTNPDHFHPLPDEQPEPESPQQQPPPQRQPPVLDAAELVASSHTHPSLTAAVVAENQQRQQRFRSLSVSHAHAWRMRPNPRYLGPEEDLVSNLPELALETTRSSQGSSASREEAAVEGSHVVGAPSAAAAGGPNGGAGKGKNPLKGMIRRASVSLKHLVPRRTSIATSTGEDHHAHHRRFLRSSHDHHHNHHPYLAPPSSSYPHHTPRFHLPFTHSDAHARGHHAHPHPSQLHHLDTDGRPATAHSSTWRRFREAAGFRHSRAPADAMESPHGSTYPVPGFGLAPPVIPHNTGGAARAAAADAAFHADALRFLSPAEWAANTAGGANGLGSSNTGGLQLPYLHNHRHLHLYNGQHGNGSSSNDGESGIGITVTPAESSEEEREKADSRLDFASPGPLDDELFGDQGSVAGGLHHGAAGVAKMVGVDLAAAAAAAAAADQIPRVDFVARLPIELAIEILSFLDGADLANVAVVSSAWRHVLTNQHVWRESFMREMTSTYATSGHVRPGTGLGIPAVRPQNDWQAVYKARSELERRWKSGTASPVYLNGHSDSIYCLQFDESKIITGSRDKTIRVWDMHTLSCRLVIGPPDVIRDPTLLHDRDGLSTHFATTETSPRAHASSPSCVSYPTHHNASILCLQYDDRILVTGSSDATCIVHSLASGYRPIRRLQHHGAAVLDLVFDDRHIVTCSKDLSICVWDRESGTLLRQLRGHAGPVNAVQMRGDTVVSCSGDFKVKLWNISTGKCIREFTGHTKGLACSQFSEDGRYVASAGNDRTIRVWDANTGECVREMKAHDNLVRSLHIDSVSGRLVSGSYDTDIMVFDMESGRQLLHFPHWHASWVLSAKSDYRRIISTGQDPKILVMDFGKGVPGIEMLESPGARDEWPALPATMEVMEEDVAGGYI